MKTGNELFEEIVFNVRQTLDVINDVIQDVNDIDYDIEDDETLTILTDENGKKFLVVEDDGFNLWCIELFVGASYDIRKIVYFSKTEDTYTTINASDNLLTLIKNYYIDSKFYIKCIENAENK